jgi:hypothetical protein
MKTWTCNLQDDNGKITITSPTGNSITIDENLAIRKNLDFDELLVLSKITNLDEPHPDIKTVENKTCITLSFKEMNLLLNIKNKCTPTPSPAIKTIDTQDKLPLTQSVKLNEEASAVKERTNTKTELGIEYHRNNRLAESDEQNVSRMENALRRMHGDIWMLIYDIPAVLNSECPNPSGLLWHYGFRLNKSCWVVPQDGLNSSPVQKLLNHWSKYSIEVHLIRYHPDEVKNIKDKCRTKLEEEIRKQHTSLIKRLDNASKRLEEARKELDPTIHTNEVEQVESKYANDVRLIMRDSIDAFQAALDCARMFDETENTKDLFKALKNVIKSEALTFNASEIAQRFKDAKVLE